MLKKKALPSWQDFNFTPILRKFSNLVSPCCEPEGLDLFAGFFMLLKKGGESRCKYALLWRTELGVVA